MKRFIFSLFLFILDADGSVAEENPEPLLWTELRLVTDDVLHDGCDACGKGMGRIVNAKNTIAG